jgi:hypothetical protein
MGAYLPELPADSLFNYVYPQAGLSASLFFEGYEQESKTGEIAGAVMVSPLPGDKNALHLASVKTKYTIHYTFSKGGVQWYVVSAEDERLKDDLIWARAFAQE